MSRRGGLKCITAADFIVRNAYQMGKTPLLPIYAASLGAGDVFLGFIVSVSTFVGLVLKPLFGVMSDRWGRRLWLVAGTTLFIIMPFVYRFVHTPEQLFVVRMFHGIATAIYGPVTLAYVVELSGRRRAETLGWFATARSSSYVFGPLAAGWMLLVVDPVSVFTVIGIMSCLAFVPVFFLTETTVITSHEKLSLIRQALVGLRSGGRTQAVWLAGGMEAIIFVVLYATKAFLPIYALSSGLSVALVGAFFAVQELVHMLANPIGGRIGDQLGHLRAIPIGMVMLALPLSLLPLADGSLFMIALACLMGLAQALIFPSTVAIASSKVDEDHLAAGMGLMGSIKNAGKVTGPALAGVLIHWLDYVLAFQLMGLCLALAALAVWQRSRCRAEIPLWKAD